MPIRFLSFLLIVTTSFIAGCAQDVTLQAEIDTLKPGIQVLEPEGDGPFPAVLLFHGCGGLVGENGEKPIIKEYAQTTVSAGFAAVIVDSFGPRDIDFDKAHSRVCKALMLRGSRRAGDILAAIQYVKTFENIEAEKLVLAGWSHGGWSIMDLMTMDLETEWPNGIKKPGANALDGVVGIYLTYPFCGPFSRTKKVGWAHTIPTQIVVAENDTLRGADECPVAFDKMRESGVPVTVETFEGVTHAFDEDDHVAKSTFVYDPEASARAHKRFNDYLKSLLEDNKYE